jgi:hypothetical protein
VSKDYIQVCVVCLSRLSLSLAQCTLRKTKSLLRSPLSLLTHIFPHTIEKERISTKERKTRDLGIETFVSLSKKEQAKKNGSMKNSINFRINNSRQQVGVISRE